MENKIKQGCNKRTNFSGNGLFYDRPICSWGNLCDECKIKLNSSIIFRREELTRTGRASP